MNRRETNQTVFKTKATPVDDRLLDSKILEENIESEKKIFKKFNTREFKDENSEKKKLELKNKINSQYKQP